MSQPIPLTDEQVENWRKILYAIIGPYALIMPRADIEQMAGMMQGDINAYSEEMEKEAELKGREV